MRYTFFENRRSTATCINDRVLGIFSQVRGMWLLNTGNIWILKFLKFGFQMVQYSNGLSEAMSSVLFKYWCSNGIKKDHLVSNLFLTIWKPDIRYSDRTCYRLILHTQYENMKARLRSKNKISSLFQISSAFSCSLDCWVWHSFCSFSYSRLY